MSFLLHPIKSTEGQVFPFGVILKMISVPRLITHLGETSWASTRGNKEASVPTSSEQGSGCGDTGEADSGPDPGEWRGWPVQHPICPPF